MRASVLWTGSAIAAACLPLFGCAESTRAAGGPDAGAESDAAAVHGHREAGTIAPHDGAGKPVSRDGASTSPPRNDASGPRGDAGAPDAPRATPGGARADGGALCPGPGFCELQNTQLASVCPDPAKYPEIQANEGCGGVIDDWSGGAADERRNRLLIWGGGHRGYFGNEVYALDLAAASLRRLDEPSSIAGVDVMNCTSPEAYADGRPSSRHTYDGLAVLPDADRMFSLGGAGIPCGYAVTGTWTLNLGTIDSAPGGQAAPWMEMKPAPYPTKAAYGVVADYDPATKTVIVNDTYNLWSYDLAANRYTLLNDSNATNAHIDYHMTGRVDPKRKLFLIAGGGGANGGGLQVFDIAAGSSHAQQDWTKLVSGCDGLLAANSPGLAYDARRDRWVGWAGGNVVYLFDADAKKCATVTYAGGPKAQENGTFGRFRYFSALDVFAVVNGANENAYTLRLPP